MDNELLSFTRVQPNEDVINQIWAFDVKNLHATEDIVISQYIIVLGQWLIYFKSQVNEIQARINQIQSDLEFLVATWMTPEILKKYKTQTAARDYLIRANPESAIMKDKLSELKHELVRLEGIDKAVIELIAAFKREMTRRENELYMVRKERHS